MSLKAQPPNSLREPCSMYYFGNIGVSNILKKGLMKTVLGMLDNIFDVQYKANTLLNDASILENYASTSYEKWFIHSLSRTDGIDPSHFPASKLFPLKNKLFTVGPIHPTKLTVLLSALSVSNMHRRKHTICVTNGMQLLFTSMAICL